VLMCGQYAANTSQGCCENAWPVLTQLLHYTSHSMGTYVPNLLLKVML
jgi:hypothetical protein